MEKRLCFNCLREGHGTRNCAKKKECFHCKKRGHSSALCKERATLTRRFLPTSTRVQAANTTQEGSVTAKETKSDEEIKMIATTVIRSKDRQETTRGDTTLTTLLLCKEVLVSNPNDPRRAAVVTAFFDSGCQGTFVTNELVKKLQLEANSLQKLTICGFGSKDPRIYDSKQVVLNIHLKNGSAKQVEAKSIERITQKIQTVDLTREDLDGLEHEEAAKLTLPTKWKAPSVVVGVDYYHQFFTGVTKHLKSGFELIESKVGTMIAGKGRIGNVSGNDRKLSANTARVLCTIASADHAVRAVKLKLANGRECTRPINLIAPLEVTNDDDPIPDEDDGRRSEPGDPHLEREDPEEEDEGSLKCHSATTEIEKERTATTKRKIAKKATMRTSQSSTSRFFLLMNVIIIFMLNFGTPTVAPTIRGHLCPMGSALTAYIPLPLDHNCSKKADSPIEKTNVTVYRKQFVRLNASYCSRTQRTVCTDALLRWHLSVAGDSTNVTGVSTATCNEMAVDKTAYGQPLHQNSKHQWSTNNPVTYSYGWFGQRCTTTTNYYFEEGEIVVQDGSHILTDLAVSCSFHGGKCATPTATILWNPQQLKHRCHYHQQGRFVAYLTKDRVLIEALQEVFVKFKNQSAIDQHCHFDQPWRMENDVILTLGPPTTDTNNATNDAKAFLLEQGDPAPDPENTRFQYIYERLKEMNERHVEEAFQRTCNNRNRINAIVRWISERDPTFTARMLTNRTDITGEAVEGGLLISKCIHYLSDETGSAKQEKEDPIFNKHVIEALEGRKAQWMARVLAGALSGGRQGVQTRPRSIAEAIREEESEVTQQIEDAVSDVENEIKAIALRWKFVTATVLLGLVGCIAIGLYCRFGCPIKCRGPRHPRSDRILIEMTQNDHPVSCYRPAQLKVPKPRRNLSAGSVANHREVSVIHDGAKKERRRH